MKQPLFNVGDKVWHTSKDGIGEVTSVFHDGEEYRYYVVHSGFAWSVPESSLEDSKRYVENQLNRKVIKGKFPKRPVGEFDPAS